MRRTLTAAILGGLLTLSLAAAASASQPPGLRGYEGQPGHHAGAGHHGANGNGPAGYEGQPGNQSH